MRDKVNVLYYPDQAAEPTTLKKAILIFDEIHFMDRPSFSFEGGMGSIGMASRLRAFEGRFRDDGVPLYVHAAPNGPVSGTFQEQIASDVNDPLFLARFQEGLKHSEAFRDLHIAHGNYEDSHTHKDVAEKIMSVDLAADLAGHESAMALLTDAKTRPFNFSNPASWPKTLIFGAAMCSAKMNVALNLGASEGFIPLADAAPYGDLLGAKYARAMRKLAPDKNRIQVTDLSFAIFDELIPAERLDKMSMEQVIAFRKASEKAREEFLEYLATLQAKQASIAADGDYSGALNKLVATEIVPAARAFKNKLQAIDESLYAALVKGAMGYAGGLSFFGDLSWGKILGIGGGAAAYVGKAAIDGLLAQRAAKRECSISYILSLDK